MIPRHQWTHDGADVLIVRQVAADGSSSHKFRYPLTVGAVVTAPDWNPQPECGGGLHGWPWGFAVGDGAGPDYRATWLVLAAAPADVIDLGGKVKCRQARVAYVGSWSGALAHVRAGHVAWVTQAASGAATASGEFGAATASGEFGAATASGWSGAATASGWSGAATASGLSGAATASGWSGAATASGASGAATASGWSGAATASGESGAATASGPAGAATVTGLKGRAQAGPYGCIALAWRNEKASRIEMRCARVGCGDGSDGHLKAGVWYRLDAAGNFVEEA